MARFNRDNKGFSKRGSSRFQEESPRFGRGDRPERSEFSGFERRGSGSFEKEMFTVTCAKCGERCEVPFKPRGDKPVFCSDCFRKNESYESRSESRSPAPSRNELDQINEKLDKIMRKLEIR